MAFLKWGEMKKVMEAASDEQLISLVYADASHFDPISVIVAQEVLRLRKVGTKELQDVKSSVEPGQVEFCVINEPKLKAYYQKRLREKKSAIDGIVWNFRWLMYGGVGLAIFFVILAIATESYDSLLFATVPPLLVPGILFAIFKSAEARLSASTDELMTTCSKAEQDRFSDIYEACAQITKKMSIQHRKHKILYSKSNQYFPSMFETDGIHYLVVPRNFITLFYERREQANAILCHEFAHMLHYDCREHLLNNFLLPHVRNFGLLLLALSVLAFFLTGTFAISLITIQGLFMYINYQQQVYESENLADLAVVVFDDGKSLCDALYRYGESDGLSSSHHSPAERRAQIEQTMREFSTSNDGPEKTQGTNELPNTGGHHKSIGINADNIRNLHFRIQIVKASLLGMDNFGSLDRYLRRMISSPVDAMKVLETYQREYNAELIGILINLSGSYDTTRKIVSIFIETNVVEKQYPHQLTKDSGFLILR